MNDDDGSEAWISPDVPFGIVQGTVPEGGLLVLKAFGTDAESSIPEEPQMMPGMGGVDVLEAIRKVDSDVAVVIFTVTGFGFHAIARVLTSAVLDLVQIDPGDRSS